MKVRALVATAVLAVGLSSAAAAAPQPAAPPLVARAFTVSAEAFPVEPGGGRAESAIAPRPTATRAKVANPPLGGYARAAASDLGLLEAYAGKQGPDAEVDTAEAEGTTDRRHEEGGLSLVAHADKAPRASARAAGNDSGDGDATAGSSTSSSTADGTKPRLVARAAATVHDVTIGVLKIGSGRFDGEASVTGKRGEAQASGRIVADDATVGGIPVVIDGEGVRVDKTKVPTDQVGLAADAVRTALSQGGYSEVRTVQPKTAIAADGSAASVGGGGIVVRVSNNDPKNNYFVTYTLLGGAASASLGGTVAGAAPPAAAPVAPRVTVPSRTPSAPVTPPRSTGGSGVAASVVGPGRPAEVAAATGGGAATIDFRGDEAAATYRLARPWTGWRWLAALVVAAFVARRILLLERFAAARARITVATDAAAVRYLRG